MSTTRVTEEELTTQFAKASGHAAMPDSWTPVGGWIRVSSDKQDERNQVQGVIQYCVQHEYWIVRWYVVHAKSASKGRQQADLDRAVEDTRDGHICVLVISDSSRIERREGKIGTELLNTLAEFTDAGGKVESVAEPTLGQVDVGSRVVTYVTGVMNTEKSKMIAREIKRAHDRIDANRGVKNRVPGIWYTIEGPEYNRHAVPTELCREYWPQVLKRCIAGESCYTIAAWLDAEGVPTQKGGRWNQGTILHLIHNPVYCGRRLGWGKDAPLLEMEAVVPVDLWVLANEAIKNRPKRGPISKTNRPMLANLKCLHCESPMYRKLIGGRLSRRYSYRCEGQGPQRRGCGNLVPLEHTDTIIAVRIFMTSTKPYKTRQWVNGWNYDAEIADTVQQINALSPLNGDDEMRRPALIAQLREYQRKNEEEAISGGYEDVDTDMTEGEHFFSLDDDGKREYLKTRDIRVEKATPADPGATRGVRVVIDGEDHGVFPYPA